MSNDNPGGDDPTRAYRPDDAEGYNEPRPFDEPEATRLQRSVPAYDPNREPASAAVYSTAPPVVAAEANRPGIAAQLVAVGLLCLLIGLGLGYFLFKGVGGDDVETPETTTTLSTVPSTTTTLATTTTTAATTTTQRSTTTTTQRATTTSQRSTTSSAAPTTTASDQ